MTSYKLTVMSPDGEVFKDDVISIMLRGAEGDLCVLAGHIPFITTVRPGKCVITLSDEEEIEGELTTGILHVTQESVQLLVGETIEFK